ncbi:putative phenylacetyl-CoA ligase [Fusarium austroafricanum]|uniref:Putative phenylacetyl-CoA ligase n=1 Tax=Fusarium austroafricanum TaxID=2364996 RepID=A0A8H4KES4_9HYPO|nr:putative phenylacetyl-CoA ligase [Fusarium austroafricanum]
MVFLPPSWVPDITSYIPPTTTVGEWALESRRATASVQPPFICALTGNKYTSKDVRENINALAKALCHELEWSPNQGTGEDKVIGVLGVNSLDFLVVCWAIHRIGGIALLLQPTTSAVEIASHMTKANCDILITCDELLPSCGEILNRLPKTPRKVYSMNTSTTPLTNFSGEIKCLPQLYEEGNSLPEIEKLQPRDAFREIAFYLTTSGTSGPQKLAKITHAAMIANVVQATAFESAAGGSKYSNVALAVLPLSHGYGLVTTHCMYSRGDSAILHPNFNMQLVLKSIQEYRIGRLYLVPSVIAALAANPVLFEIFDLSSAHDIVLGAAACSDSVTKKINSLMPHWKLLVGYGLTECVSIVTYSRSADIMPGSSGVLLPSNQARLLDQDGQEVNTYNTPGQLYVKSAALIPGYLGDDAGNTDFVVDGWLPTGDICFFRRSPHGDDHLFLVDRLKDMIKVKGLQVNPAEIEELLRKQPGVIDAAVIGIHDDDAGERPLAFVVPVTQEMTDQQRKELILQLDESVKAEFDETHWLRKQVRFIDELPRGQSGKVLKRILREKVKQMDQSTVNGTNGVNGINGAKGTNGTIKV